MDNIDLVRFSLCGDLKKAILIINLFKIFINFGIRVYLYRLLCNWLCTFLSSFTFCGFWSLEWNSNSYDSLDWKSSW